MNKHPYNRQVLYINNPGLRYSVREIRESVNAGALHPNTLVHDANGSYSAQSIAQGKAPRWALSATYDPVFFGGLPLPSADDMALAHEAACEDDFEMPTE